ncbi:MULTISPECIES: hypothetical protein [Lachnospiraceae]|nr:MULTISPECIES: hypothetical protein [Lachnospiraceae]UOX71206.1 hypothetical protein K4205_05975 [Enterocloster bolteae]
MKRIEAKPDTPDAPCVWSVRLFILPGREVFDWMLYNGNEASVLPLAAGD